MKGLESMGFPRDQVLARLRKFLDQFFEDLACAHKKRRWADKTPYYIDCLNDIDEVYRSSPRYVMIYRHGLDAAMSITKALPDLLAELSNGSSHIDKVRAAAAYWRKQVGKMQTFQAAHPGRCFKLSYEDLVINPEPVLREMFGFLGEPFEQQVLRFNEQPHDPGLEDRKVAGTRTFEPSIQNYRKWDQDTLRAALAEAGPALRSLGYDV
jgi:protein-tyrosine sulfotransferase